MDRWEAPTVEVAPIETVIAEAVALLAPEQRAGIPLRLTAVSAVATGCAVIPVATL